MGSRKQSKQGGIKREVTNTRPYCELCLFTRSVSAALSGAAAAHPVLGNKSAHVFFWGDQFYFFHIFDTKFQRETSTRVLREATNLALVL